MVWTQMFMKERQPFNEQRLLRFWPFSPTNQKHSILVNIISITLMDQPVLRNAQHHNNKNTPVRLSLISTSVTWVSFEAAGPADGTSSGCCATEGRGSTHRSSHPGCRWCWWCCCATHPRKPQAAPLYSAILAGPLQLTLRFIRREESLRLLQEPLRLVRLVAGQRRRGDVDAPLRLVPVDFHCGGTRGSRSLDQK